MPLNLRKQITSRGTHLPQRWVKGKGRFEEDLIIAFNYVKVKHGRKQHTHPVLSRARNNGLKLS